MRKTTRVRATTCLAVSGLLLSACGGGGESGDGDDVELTIAHAAPPDFIYAKVSQFFADSVEDCTGGAVTAREIGGGSLGDDVTLLDLYTSGDVDLGFHYSPAVGTVAPEVAFLGTPFLFDSLDHWSSVMTSEEARTYWEEAVASADAGFEVAAFNTLGMRNVYTKSAPIRQVEDLRGLQLRLPASPFAIPYWRELDVQPVELPVGDTYSGLQTGVVEGAENTPSGYLTLGHNEVARTYSLTGHEVATSFLLARDDLEDDLEPDNWECVQQAIEEADDFWTEEAASQNEAALAEFDELGVEVVEVADSFSSDVDSRVSELRESIAADSGAEEFLEMVSQER